MPTHDHQPFLVVIAPDKFRGSLPAHALADALARGANAAAQRLHQPIRLITLTMSDGGEGFANAIAAAAPTTRHTIALHALSALAQPITINAIAIPDLAGASPTPDSARPPRDSPPSHAGIAHTAIAHPAIAIESASLLGHELVPPHARDPERLTTAGLGHAIRAAIDARPHTIIIGLGGTLTVDGGIGMASALGYRFLDQRGRELPPLGASLQHIATIEPPATSPDPRQPQRPSARPHIIAACDVMAPLTGDAGAARRYAPQKGATPDAVLRLEQGLTTLRQRCLDAGLITPTRRDEPGDGAAGGLGFGIRAFLAGTLAHGAALLADHARLDHALHAAHLVLTGEGSLDEQTMQGKVVAEVIQRAANHDTPAAIICGRAIPNAATMRATLQRRVPNASIVVASLLEHAHGDETRAHRDADQLTAELAEHAVARAIAAHRQRTQPRPSASDPTRHPTQEPPDPARPIPTPPNHP